MVSILYQNNLFDFEFFFASTVSDICINIFSVLCVGIYSEAAFHQFLCCSLVPILM